MLKEANDHVAMVCALGQRRCSICNTVVGPDGPQAVRGRLREARSSLGACCHSWQHAPRLGTMAGTESAANLLRSLRRQQGHSLRSAAADIGVAPSQLSRIERGQRGLGMHVSERLASYYGVSPELIALSRGDLPPDVVRILQAHPELIAQLRATYSGEPGLEEHG